MASQAPTRFPFVRFTPGQLQALRLLRDTYQQDRDLLSGRERARLRFMRWLYVTGRLQP